MAVLASMPKSSDKPSPPRLSTQLIQFAHVALNDLFIEIVATEDHGGLIELFFQQQRIDRTHGKTDEYENKKKQFIGKKQISQGGNCVDQRIPKPVQSLLHPSKKLRQVKFFRIFGLVSG